MSHWRILRTCQPLCNIPSTAATFFTVMTDSPSPVRGDRSGQTAKIDWQASQNNAFYVRHIYSRSRTTGNGSGLNDLTRAGTAGMNDSNAAVAQRNATQATTSMARGAIPKSGAERATM